MPPNFGYLAGISATWPTAISLFLTMAAVPDNLLPLPESGGSI
jgi:hypothetical protein